MKTLIIPDLHGRNYWKELVNTCVVDNVVFLGDYLDSFHIPSNIQYQNLMDIIEYKQKNEDKATLILGNHDVQYVGGIICPGHQKDFHNQYKVIFNQYKNLFVIGKQIGNVLFTHAGLSKWVLEEMTKLMPAEASYAAICNIMYKMNDSYLMGDDGPFWIRPNKLINQGGAFTEVIQIVGHTPYENAKIYISPISGGKIYFLDVKKPKGRPPFIWDHENDTLSVEGELLI